MHYILDYNDTHWDYNTFYEMGRFRETLFEVVLLSLRLS